ncbi:Mu-like prophage major head subunit gpT family protein [Campylobacter corcagiensis]|uniref:Mu-like prophage major head subunit gpT family protein n=1 Tax=Campylobacter corcagiensis TaxID=1448857 RepID=A0A7M1LFQ9_9BACT|nr:Mu-like prophage major head subunit gpT family protein [Campylobacter corcagiensis]QKF64566.1 Mu-like prophage major head subunit gpT [Campylobacter corcagiensis]QOQ87260.1 Mu-like prophage major head subunit gpT family protein [Campylobacter corcagiensis]
MAHFEETAIGFKAIFQKTFNDVKSEADTLAMRVNSNNLSEKYVWLGNFPMMKEWVGDRDIKKFKDYGYTLENQPFEATVTVPNNHLEYDKVGLYKPAIEQMAFNAKKFGAKLVADILLTGESSKCYDGLSFFNDAHKIGNDTYANLGTGVLNSENLIAAQAFMMSIKGDSGQSLGVMPSHLVCGPKNLANAIKTIEKDLLVGGETNPTYKRYELLVMPEITDSSWYLMDLSKPVKPFVLQVAKDGVFEASNDHHFMKDAALFGCKSFMNAGYALWQLAYKSSGA